MAVVHTPTLRGRRLALELRRLRETAELSQSEVARRLAGWNASKVSRIEKPELSITDEDLRALLQLYGVNPDQHPALLQLNQDSWQRGWWTVYGDVFVGNYVVLESQAQEIEMFQSMFVPGLFQTPRYAADLFLRMQSAGDADIGRRVEARMARQSILRRPHPPRVHAIIDEAAVRRVVGDRAVMAEQIAELRRLAALPDVTVQVVPFDAGAHEGLDGPFTIFGHPDDRGLDVAYTEGQHGAVSLESVQDIARIRVVFQSVSKAALSPEETSAWLAAQTRE